MMKNKKRIKHQKDILFLCQYFYPEYISSATLPFDTAEGFVKAGYQVDVICGYPKEYTKTASVPYEEVVNGIHIHRVKYLSVDRSNILLRLLNFITLLLGILFKLPQMKQYKTIFVYSNPPVLPVIAVLAKKLYKNKIIFVSYDVYPELALLTGDLKENGLPVKLFHAMNKMIFHNVDWVIALSKDMKKLLSERRGISAKKIAVIPNWYQDEGHPEKKPGRETNLFKSYQENDFVVSYLGNMGTIQDMETIIKAIDLAKQNAGIKFIFAGHGNKLKELKNTIKKNNYHHVSVFDYLQGEDFKDVLSISNCFVVSLRKGSYGLCNPSKAASYMMQGRPVLCIMDKNMELARDIVDHKIGFCIDNQDANAFYDSILYLMEHKEEYDRMCMKCRKIFLAKYEKSICIEKYITFISKILHS